MTVVNALIAGMRAHVAVDVGHDICIASEPAPSAGSHAMSGRRGASTTEYVLLISVIIVAIVSAGLALQSGFHEGVSEVAQDVKVLLSGEGNEAVASRDESASAGCPFVYDPRTGRWHDTSDGGYLMVGFSDAADAGCSN